MSITYFASYYDAAVCSYGAKILLSADTITIRYKDKSYHEKEVCWPTKDTVFWQQTILSELQYKNNNGQVERLVFGEVEFIQAIKKIPVTPGYIPGIL